MRNTLPIRRSRFGDQMTNLFGARSPRHLVIGVILLTALLAFELFNFDTTRYALNSLLGEVRFMGIGWATILAIAFCSIDFAGLARLFTPERGRDEPKEVWYLMGAWLLGATMNAVMTWWAVSLTLLDHPLGNEIMTREQLLQVVPIFVAVLVWLTRILFIGSLTVAGEHIFTQDDTSVAARPSATPTARPVTPSPAKPKPSNSRNTSSPNRLPNTAVRPATGASFSAPTSQPTAPMRDPQPNTGTPQRTSRIRRQNGATPSNSPTAKGPATRPNMPVGMKASPKRYS
ncbi:MAG: hypothetical protein KDD89_05250 [Anaerolineales bacterium]|nr:hypothetical protein [Anaerolineales bacterium]